MPDRIVHIGLPKTGTTFLQKNVFPNLRGLTFYDYKICDQLFYEIIFLDELDYQGNNVKPLFKPYFTNSTTLFSFESLAGAPFIYKGANRSLIPERLKNLSFNKIIISIRNQAAMMDSLYRQYVVQGGVMKFRSFIDVENQLKLSVKPFYLGYLEYDKLIRKYWEVFGKENVLIVQQEDLKLDTEKFVSRIISFSDSKGLNENQKKGSSNESLTNVSIYLLRICNHFIYTSQKPNNLISNKLSSWIIRRIFAVILDPFLFRFFSSKKSFVKSSQKAFLLKYFRESNMQLEKEAGIKLSKSYFK